MKLKHLPEELMPKTSGAKELLPPTSEEIMLEIALALSGSSPLRNRLVSLINNGRVLDEAIAERDEAIAERDKAIAERDVAISIVLSNFPTDNQSAQPLPDNPSPTASAKELFAPEREFDSWLVRFPRGVQLRLFDDGSVKVVFGDLSKAESLERLTQVALALGLPTAGNFPELSDQESVVYDVCATLQRFLPVMETQGYEALLAKSGAAVGVLEQQVRAKKVGLA